MEPNTLRLQTNTWEELAEEAEELGYTSRSAYIRELINHREVITDAIGPNTQTNTDVIARLDRLAARVDDLEAERQLANRARDVREADRGELEELEDLIEAGEEADRSGAAQSAAQRREPTGDREAGDDGSRSAAHSADARDAAFAAADGWEWTDEPRGDPEEYRETFRAVVRTLDERGPMGKSDLLEAVYPDHPAGFEKRNNWWKNLALEFLQDLRDEHGLAHTTGGGRWTKWQLGRDPDE